MNAQIDGPTMSWGRRGLPLLGAVGGLLLLVFPGIYRVRAQSTAELWRPLAGIWIGRGVLDEGLRTDPPDLPTQGRLMVRHQVQGADGMLDAETAIAPGIRLTLNALGHVDGTRSTATMPFRVALRADGSIAGSAPPFPQGLTARLARLAAGSRSWFELMYVQATEETVLRLVPLDLDGDRLILAVRGAIPEWPQEVHLRRAWPGAKEGQVTSPAPRIGGTAPTETSLVDPAGTLEPTSRTCDAKGHAE